MSSYSLFLAVKFVFSMCKISWKKISAIINKESEVTYFLLTYLLTYQQSLNYEKSKWKREGKDV